MRPDLVDMLDSFWRNMFCSLAVFRWMWTDFIVWYWVGSYAVPTCQKEYLTYELDKMQTHVAETRLQRKQCRIVSFVFPIVAPNPSQSIDPWKWNEVNFPLHLSWSVFCSSSIEAPFVSCLIYSCCSSCESQCRRRKCLRCQKFQQIKLGDSNRGDEWFETFWSFQPSLQYAYLWQLWQQTFVVANYDSTNSPKYQVCRPHSKWIVYVYRTVGRCIHPIRKKSILHPSALFKKSPCFNDNRPVLFYPLKIDHG